MSTAPLNGTKTHPLSKHALEVLRDLTNGPVPTMEINPGVVIRLHCEDLSRSAPHASPYNSSRGTKISHEFITDAGRRAIQS